MPKPNNPWHPADIVQQWSPNLIDKFEALLKRTVVIKEEVHGKTIYRFEILGGDIVE